MRIALLGVGTIGRELIRRTSGNPMFSYVALGDRSGVIAIDSTFTDEGLGELVRLKEAGGRLKDHDGDHEYYKSMKAALVSCSVDALVDATDAQTHGLLHKALEHAHVVTSNKIPIADVPYSRFRGLVSKARDEGRILDFGTTVGAGMRFPDMIRSMGSDGIERVAGCLSGTMNYVSQRINEGRPLSMALKEAMEPPRQYTEPDPRVDLGGEDFARKLVIIGRMCGRSIDLDTVEIEELVPEPLKKLPVEEFLEALTDLDPGIRSRIERANSEGKKIWYLGTADLREDVYSIGFEDVPVGDPITSAKESDNVLKLYPSRWRRMVTISGPGAGPPETVTGVIYGLRTVANNLRTEL